MELYPDRQTLFDQAPVGYFTTDQQGRILLINQTLLDWLGYRAEELLDKCWSEVLLSGVGRAFFASHATPLLQLRHAVTDLLIDLRDQQQHRVPVLLSATRHDAVTPDTRSLVRFSVAKAIDRVHFERQLMAAKHQAEDASDRLRELAADLEKMVAQRTAELTAAYQDLDRFTYTVSHDLRAPLRVVSGYCDLLVVDAGDQLDEASATHLQQIRQAVQTMNAMIDGLLQLSLGARAELQRTTIDITALATRICQELAISENNSQVQWLVQSGMRIAGDERLLEVVLRNLIGNAWKYSSRVAQPTIRIGAEEVQQEWIFSVVDNGIGFDAAQAEQLFQPFKRLSSGREFPGMGVGLSTVKRIVERHGGRVYATSTPGQGATFCVALPIAASSPQSDSLQAGY